MPHNVTNAEIMEFLQTKVVTKQDLALFDQRLCDVEETVAAHDKYINGNGNPGVKSDLAEIKTKLEFVLTKANDILIRPVPQTVDTHPTSVDQAEDKLGLTAFQKPAVKWAIGILASGLLYFMGWLTSQVLWLVQTHPH